MDETRSSGPAVLRFGVFEADLRSGELRKQGARLKLQGQPFDILVILLQRPGEVVTREELRAALWPEDTFVDFDHSLNTAINKLRNALGDSGSNPRFVETMARRGYRFIAPVSAADGRPVAPGITSPKVPSEHQVETEVWMPARFRDEELPKPARGLVRVLFEMVQAMYLAMYVAALWHLGGVEGADRVLPAGVSLAVTIMVAVLAAVGIPVRCYMFSAVAFDFRGFASKFRRLFPAILGLDELWALTPFLLAERIGFGLAFAATAALLYVPFGQRTLVRMGYEGIE